MENEKKEPVINYFPGHMNKALGKIKETVHNVEAVIIVLDSRAPLSSFPYGLDELTKDKQKLVLLSKRDLADNNKTKEFLYYFQKRNVMVFDADLRNKAEIKNIRQKLSEIKTPRDRKFESLKLPLPPIKCMVLGIPNVGKSTIINALGEKNRAATENVPGKTRKTTLFKATKRLWIFDTPGILEPDIHDRDSMVKLALLGSVKDDILPHDYLVQKLLSFLKENYPTVYASRYQIEQDPDPDKALADLAAKRNFLLPNGKLDVPRAVHCLLQEFKDGKLGGITLDEPR